MLLSFEQPPWLQRIKPPSDLSKLERQLLDERICLFGQQTASVNYRKVARRRRNLLGIGRHDNDLQVSPARRSIFDPLVS